MFKHNKRTVGKRLLTLFLTACMVFSTMASTLGVVAYADSSVPSSTANSISVNPGEAVSSETVESATSQSGSSSSSSSEVTSDSGVNSDASSSLPTDGDSSIPENPSSSVPPADSSVSADSSSSEEPTEDELPSDDSQPVDEEPEGEDEGTEQDEFVSLAILDPENGEMVEAEIGDEVTLSAQLNRDDVLVSYQWQRLQKPDKVETVSQEAIHEYAEDEPTWYNFPLEDKTEAQLLSESANATWSGVEMYYAVVAALDEIEADSSNVSLAWRTPNYALDGYAISAADVDGNIEVYADKDDKRFVARLNDEGKWAFGGAETHEEEKSTWQDIEGAIDPDYTFTVQESDYNATYRCAVTVLDEEYLAECIEILKGQSVELSEEELATPQTLYSIVMQIHSDEWDALQMDGEAAKAETFSSMLFAMRAGGTPKPYLSADAQWIEGLNGNYEYITKDTYDRVSQWLKEGRISQTQAERYWTVLTNGFHQTVRANVLDDDGFPVGDENNYRVYNGFDLTDGMLEVNSEWYGKTVYFRVFGSTDTGTAISIPAYTDLTIGPDGEYIEAAAGTRYKKAITLLNPFVPDTGSVYYNYMQTATDNGWMRDSAGVDIHMRVYAVNCEAFNRDPQKYMVDAEGNYRMDSVAWGVCTYQEPDISGKAYWVLKDYIANGYGFLTGHDTMYAYAGAYYDAFGRDLDENSIDPNDGTTWYYDINSWLPGTSGTSSDGATSTARGGHFYTNELMGSNAGNVDSGTVTPSDAPSMILSIGGSHGKYGKGVQFGTEQLRIVQTGYSAAQAQQAPKYRTPTNYPYSFGQGSVVGATFTHTNQQAAFGTIWVDYYGINLGASLYGHEANPRSWLIGEKRGTNNFYLTGDGNYLMNQVGHLPRNSATRDEARIFVNSVMFISQRKQCEVCQSEQGGAQASHFVHRVNSTNVTAILSALAAGGTYWYPIDDCYMLTEDIALPADWTPIKNFSGHFNADVYTVTLGTNGAPLFEHTDTPAGKYTSDGNANGWNLGDDKTKGVEDIVKDGDDAQRTTGVARVLGTLPDLFGTTGVNYSGYTVKILGDDNPRYLPSGAEYSCVVNNESKYVISNLPCVYTGTTGTLKARVYDTAGKEVTAYGTIKTDVRESFWDTNMTTPLYLADFNAKPVLNQETYEEQGATFTSTISFERKLAAENIKWQWRANGTSDWSDISTGPWADDYVISEPVYEPDDFGDVLTTTRLSLAHCLTTWSGYQFRAVFSDEIRGTVNSHNHYRVGKVYYTVNTGDCSSACSNAGGVYYRAAIAGFAEGELTVKPWPFKVTQAPDTEVWVGEDTTYSVAADYLKGIDDGLQVEWQYATDEYAGVRGEWVNIEGSSEFIDNTDVVTASEDTSIAVYDGIERAYGFPEVTKKKTHTTLTVEDCDFDYNLFVFRAKFSITSPSGVKYEWYSDASNNLKYKWDAEDVAGYGEPAKGATTENQIALLTVKPADIQVVLQRAADEPGSDEHIDDLTPDEYGQLLYLDSAEAEIVNETATYTAVVYYRPGTPIMSVTPNWKYCTYLDMKFRAWDDSAAHTIDPRITTNVTNTPLGVLEQGDKYYNEEYAGWEAVKSVMTIDNAPHTMFDTATLTKYFFRCDATGEYETAKGTRYRYGHSAQGGLVIDHDIALHHKGVNLYHNRNIINGQEVTDMEGMQSATSGKAYSVWNYPDLQLIDPKSVNMVLVQYSSEGFHSSNSISYDAAYAASIGVSVTGNQYCWTFTARTKDSVTTEQWETLLRGMNFTTYDKFTINADGTISGGAEVFWYADENNWENYGNIYYNSSNGHFYEYVSAPGITWHSAYASAQNRYFEPLDTYGYLMTITSAGEQSMADTLARGNHFWLGCTRDNSYTVSQDQWVWEWVCGPERGQAFFRQWPGGVGGYSLSGMYNHWDYPAVGGGAQEPNNSNGEYYGHLYRAGYWNDYPAYSPTIAGYMVEYGTSSENALTRTNHSTFDNDRIGTGIAVEKRNITVKVSDKSKVYDKTELMPDIVVTTDSTGLANPAALVNAEYTCKTPTAEYAQTSLLASATSGSKIINAGEYVVTLSLTQEAINNGYSLTEDSVTSANLTVTKRPINLYSYHNNKVYDRTSAGFISGIAIAERTEDSGVIAGDTVRLNTTTAYGAYVDKNGEYAIHNSETNNNGKEYAMRRNASLSDLSIVHDQTSDPHYNYKLEAEDYTGAITPRGVYVHSLYLEDPDNPRNVKAYDGTDSATITNILMDNVMAGDEIGLKRDSVSGAYETINASEKLNEDGTAQADRFKKLEESVITAKTKAELTGNDYGDYFVEKEAYSGAISRALLEVRIPNLREMYGSEKIENPWHTNTFEAGKNKYDGWLQISGLVGKDKIELSDSFFKFGVFDEDGARIDVVGASVGEYPVTLEGLNEKNLPVLENYITAVYNGRVEIYPREILVTVDDGDRYELDESVPKTNLVFEMLNDDEEAYRYVGTDETDAYADMLLVGNDTVEEYVRVTDGQALPEYDAVDNMLRKEDASEMKQYGTDAALSTMFTNGSNVLYTTDWHVGAPARYIDINNDMRLYSCDWCEEYHGYSLGTEHWRLAGYEMSVNRDAEKGNVLDVATVTNPLGKKVQNYTLRFIPGTLRVHPKLRFQLEATVPLQVCMYGYAGDGEVVEPENYGITNYSNGSIKVTDIEVSADGWTITDKAPLDLLRGEMTMNMLGTQLVYGHNTPSNPERWIIAEDSSEDESGTKMVIPMTCYIAGGNVNERQESYVAKVTYTVAEHGVTVPAVDGATIPDFINGQPVTVAPNR